VNSRILLTGGTGFFGRALLRHFVMFGMASDSSVCVLSREPQRFLNAYPEFANSEGISFVQADIEDRDSLPWTHSYTHVVHAATDSTYGPNLTPLRRFEQIVNGTALILELAVATGAKRFLLTSSGGIYGRQPTHLSSIPEDWPGCLPLDQAGTAYSQAKRAAEHLCCLYQDRYGLETVITRCFSFVGRDLPLDAHFAIGNFIRDALYCDQITVSGDGSPLRTYLDQRDLARWLWTLLYKGLSGQAYNVGSDAVISIGELANCIRQLISPNKPVKILAQSGNNTERSHYVPDISKVYRLHGLLPEIALQRSIIDVATSFT
jgi:UDP-glucuronate decarboxylase